MSVNARLVHLVSAGQPSLQLEGRWHLPSGRGPFPAAVVAHPHSLMGGSMHNQVVVWMARTLAGRGWAALRINFRGVGGSQGHYDEGRGETDDLIGALDWLAAQREVDAARLAVVGYSFGARVGGRAACRDERVCAYAGVALTRDGSCHVDLSHLTCPKCFVVGARDTLSPPEWLRPYVGALPAPRTLHVIPDADHMLCGYEQVVADHVADFLASFLGREHD